MILSAIAMIGLGRRTLHWGLVMDTVGRQKETAACSSFSLALHFFGLRKAKEPFPGRHCAGFTALLILRIFSLISSVFRFPKNWRNEKYVALVRK
jgi:hypothetical protein